MLPQFLPDSFISSHHKPELVLLADLFDNCANPEYVLPKRPAEDAEVYAYRKKSYSGSFPLRTAVNQLLGAVTGQKLTFAPKPTATETQVDISQAVLEQFNLESTVEGLTKALTVFGKCWVLPLTPAPKVVPLNLVLASGDDLLVWREFETGVLNPETFEVQDFCRVYVIKEGMLGVYQCEVQKVKDIFRPDAEYRSTNFQPKNLGKGSAAKDKNLELFGEPQAVGGMMCAESVLSIGADGVDLVISYLRLKAAMADIVTSSGYIQRVVTPEAAASLDLPIEIEDYSTSNAHLIKAASFEFAEMAGTSITAMMKLAEAATEEQLREMGLNLSAGAGASGASREIDASRFKVTCDLIGQQVERCITWLVEQYLTLAGTIGSPKDCPVFAEGLSNYNTTNRLGVVEQSRAVVDFYLTLPYEVPAEAYQSEFDKVADRICALGAKAEND